MKPVGRLMARVLGWVIAGWTLCLTGLSSETAPRGTPMVEADNAVISVYSAGKRQAEVILRLGKVRRGYERRGFFRIGVLPMLRVQDVSIEFQETQVLRARLDGIAREISELANKRLVSLENVTVRFPGEAEPRLRADAVKFGVSGCWELSGNVRFTFAGESVRTPKAQLNVSGEEAGKLLLFLPDHAITTDLFEPGRNHKPKHPDPEKP